MDTPLASTHSLAVTPQSLLKRKSTDRAFGVAYVIVLLVTFGIAIAAGLKNNIDGMLHDAQCGPQSSNVNGTDTFTANAIVAEVPELLAIPIISVLIGMAWMGAMRACAKGMVYGTLIGQGLVLGGLTLAFLAIPGLTILAIFFGIIFAMYMLMLFCARKKINLTATLIEQAATVVQVHPQVFLSSVLLMTLGAIVYGACTAAALLLLTNGDWVLSNSTSDGVVILTSGSGTTCQWQIPNAAVAGLSFVGFASLWSVEVFSAMRFYVVSFVTGVWYFKASGMAAQEGGSGTVTNPVTTATKLAFTKSFGTICLTGLIMYIVELLRRMAKKQSQNNGLTGVLIACCINCLVAYLEFITRFALTLHALTGDDLCTSARTFTSHLNRHGFSAVWVNWMASWVFNFSAFALSLLITAICLVMTSHPQRGITALIVIGILSFIFAIVFLSFVAGILLNIIDACYSCLILDLDHGAKSQPQVAQAILILANPTYLYQHQSNDPQPTVAVAYAQPYAPQPTTASCAQPSMGSMPQPTVYGHARPIVSEYVAK